MNSVEIVLQPGLTLCEASTQYNDWLERCDWGVKPSFLYWWFATENDLAKFGSAFEMAEAFVKYAAFKREQYGEHLNNMNESCKS